MEKRHKKPGLKDECADTLLVPPGFISKTSFILNKAPGEETFIGLSSLNAAREKLNLIDSVSYMNDVATPRSSQPQQCDDKEDDHAQEESGLEPPSETCLPKGVVRGCTAYSNCLKVTSRWCPEDARKIVLEDAPVFTPTREEFSDLSKYVATIRHKAEAYGICRIVPPPLWNPPRLIEEKNIWETSQFVARPQRVDGVDCRYFNRTKASQDMSLKRTSSFAISVEHSTSNGNSEEHAVVGSKPDPEFTLKTFKELADSFKEQYFCSRNKLGPYENQNDCEMQEPSVDDIEGEYQRIIENPTDEIEVLCGDNLNTRIFGSGFPVKSESLRKSDHREYIDSDWNLNNTAKLPSSLLSFESHNTSGALIPRLQIGMCFSSCFWNVEEHHLYSLCYMHLGAAKIWYGIPGRYNVKFKSTMRKYIPEVEQPESCDMPVRQLSPSKLKALGIPVFRCVQNPGEFVLLFPATYYSGFSCGFNCVEAANFAPLDWLLHGQHIAELYCEQRRKTFISHDKLLFGAASEAVREILDISLLRKKDIMENTRWKDACGTSGILTNAFKSRVHLEANRRTYLCCPSQLRRMDRNFDDDCKRECCICSYDLHLSAAHCRCSPNRYSCLIHSKQLCSCAWTDKIILFRHDIDELNVLVEALEGKLSAVYRWAKKDIRLVINTSFLAQLQSPSHLIHKASPFHQLAEEKHGNHNYATPDNTQMASMDEGIKARAVGERKSMHRPDNRISPKFNISLAASGLPVDVSSASGSSDSE